jgi:lysyl-tRNA synthetase class 2
MIDRHSNEVQQRLAKLARFKERGVLPYPPRVKRSHSVAEALATYQPETNPDPAEDTQFQLSGRLMSIRVMGKSTFAHLEDGTGRIQIYLQKNALGDEAYDIFRKDFDIGDFVAVAGTLFTTRTGEITLRVQSYELAAKALHPLPEKWHGLKDTETRYRQRYLDLIANPEVRDVFIKRTKIVSAMRRYLDRVGFLEVETPALQPVYGGALARPFTTYHNVLDTTLYLRISDELYLKRLIVGGLDKVYEICKDFRNEGISTKHNPEFTMMECYWAYADYADMMQLTENMIADIAQQVLDTPQITYQGHEIDLTPPWRRISLAEALRQAVEIDIDVLTDMEALWADCQRLRLKVAPQPTWGKLVEALLSDYVEPNLIQPTFVHTYPIDISPLSKQCPDDLRMVERFELFIAGREIGNAYSELNDPLAQQERFEDLSALAAEGDGETHPVDEDYVAALMYGMPPTGGLGIGVDRLAMLLTDQSSIREVILFPTLRPRA